MAVCTVEKILLDLEKSASLCTKDVLHQLVVDKIPSKMPAQPLEEQTSGNKGYLGGVGQEVGWGGCKSILMPQGGSIRDVQDAN